LRNGALPAQPDEATSFLRCEQATGELQYQQKFHGERTLTMQTKADRIKVPHFATESEEAKWWDDHKEMVEENLIQAMRCRWQWAMGPLWQRIFRRSFASPFSLATSS
jgi:hypothetical protein